jgi:3-phosphoshikimate 1-carboxyvinyltransferase
MLILAPNTIDKGKSFSFDLPYSKSVLNRLLVLDFLSNHKDFNRFPNEKNLLPKDVLIMLEALNSINGAKAEKQTIDVGDAATAARFLTAVLANRKGNWILDGSDRMRQRPMRELITTLKLMGANIVSLEKENHLPLSIKGASLKAGKYDIVVERSSQFATALLLIAPFLDKDSSFHLKGKIASLPYIDLSISLMQDYGFELYRSENIVHVKAKTPDKRNAIYIERDWSAAAVYYSFLCTGLFSEFFFKGLSFNDKQGDKAVREIFSKLGVKTVEENEGIRIFYDKRIAAKEDLTFDLSMHPDIFPYLLVAVLIIKTKAIISGVKNLDFKESERLSTMVKQLNTNGFEIEIINADTILVSKTAEEFPTNLVFDCKNDHRLIMAFSVFGTLTEVHLSNHSGVEKSYPQYWKDTGSFFNRKENV